MIFSGTVDPNIIDIQININGAGFVSDPSLIGLTLPTFTIPNLAAYPNGLPLEKGINTIQLRAIDLSGAFSSASTVTVEVVTPDNLGIILAPPTGIRMQRNATSVKVQWSDLGSDNITGYNVYASTGVGGSGSGYLRLNQDIIPSSSPTEIQQQEFQAASVSFSFDNPAPSDSIIALLQADSKVADLVVSSKTILAADGSKLADMSLNTFPLIGTPKFRIEYNLYGVASSNFFSFSHNKNDGIGNGILNSDIFSIISDEDPLFYVVTAVVFDKATGTMQESRFSQEVAGSPLPLDTTVRGIRIREQRDIVSSYIGEIQGTQPTLSLIPGSSVREVHIEPFGNEMQKGYFLLDFVHRAKSFVALLAIDDPGLTGTSVSVANSGYKQNLKAALSLSSDVAVQSLVDGAFDSLALNFGVARLGRRPAVVNQTFFTTIKPVKDMTIAQDAIVSSSQNSLAPRFRTKGAAVLTAANAQAFYNQDSRRYEIKVQMVAEVPGSIGMLAADDLDTVVSGADGFQTINESSTEFGRDTQSNLELSEESTRVLSSLDTGTEGGYELKAIGTPGLIQVLVVKSGDPDMQRDYDPIRNKHIGGKVDIWVKGVIERTITETFAFQFDIAKNVRFDVIDPINLIFRARDSRLTVNNPIDEMLFNPAQGLGLRNHSDIPTQSYDLTGVEVIDYRTIRLSTVIPQPSTLLDDFVEGDYRFRNNNRFTASIQPIRRVTAVVGEVSGALEPDIGFQLFKIQDPLLEGESTRATDYVEIEQVDNIPAGVSIPVNDEQHVMIGEFEEPLNSVGINTFTLRVFSKDRIIEYNGPDDPNPDYLIITGTQTRPLKLVRTAFSNIPNGSTISIDYEKDENFGVTYVVNDVLQQLQTTIEQGTNNLKNAKHVTADVLVKQAVENPMVNESTVQLGRNADQGSVDADIRTGLTILTDSRGVGGSIHQSDVVKVYEDVNGMDFVVQPFTRLTLQDGALRIRDSVPSEYIEILSLEQSANGVYILTEPLPFNTSDGGGGQTVHHGVYKDEIIMTPARSLDDIGSAPNQAWVIGRQGAVINGYSDDATLVPLFVTPSAVIAERIRRTANKVMVSLNAGIIPRDLPTDHTFAATYVVQGDQGVKDIETSQIEYITPGVITITYRAAS
jgi:hypothetical protein